VQCTVLAVVGRSCKEGGRNKTAAALLTLATEERWVEEDGGEDGNQNEESRSQVEAKPERKEAATSI
jgi:hypothetical protein